MPLTFKIEKANWSAPSNIVAFNSTRHGGVSKPPFNNLNLGAHVNDCPKAVANNRNLISNAYLDSKKPLWLNQTHSTKVIVDEEHQDNIEADAIVSRQAGKVLVVMTADCLPILLCNQQGTEVAAIHAGWRSLANGIINTTLARMKSPPNSLMAWLGPCISQAYFEVGPEVVNAFANIDSNFMTGFQYQTNSQKYHACLPTLASNQLIAAGVSQLNQNKHCTFKNKQDYFSYRREKNTGRMGSFIYIK